MIIYGSKAKELVKEIITDKCPNCGNQNTIDMHVFQKYAHVFWIPLFPIGKTGVSQCDHCKQVLKLNQMPPHLKTAYTNLKAQAKTPIWMFIGSALIVALIIFAAIEGNEKDAKNAKLILSPQMGDVFEVKTKEGDYTLYKVALVEADSVFIRVNEFQVNKSSGLYKIREKGDVAFSQDLYGFSKAELKKMQADGEIIDIDRR
jgi:hypothetical protein